MRSVIETFCWCMLLIILLSMPLLHGAYYNYQWLFFSFLTFLLLSCYLLLLATGQSYNKRALLQAKPLFILMFFQVAWLFIQSSQFFSNTHELIGDQIYGVQQPAWFVVSSSISLISVETKLEIMQLLFYMALLFMLLGMLKGKTRIIVLLVCLGVSGSIHAAIGLGAKLMQVHLVEIQALDGHWHEARGLFVNRNHFAAFINLCLVCLAVYPVRSMLKKKLITNMNSTIVLVLDTVLSFRSAILFMIVICFSALLLSTSRAGVLSLSFSVGFGSLLVMLIDKKSTGLKAIFLLMLMLFILALLWLGGDMLFNRVMSGAFDIGERAEQWQITLSAISDYWLMGAGAGTYEAVFQFYRSSYDGLRQVVFDQAHSEYLQILLEQGVIGFFLWMAIIFYVFRILLIQYIQLSSTLMKAVVFCCLVGISAALIQALVDFNLQMPAIRAYFYCLVALAIAATQIYKKYDKKDV